MDDGASSDRVSRNLVGHADIFGSRPYFWYRIVVFFKWPGDYTMPAKRKPSLGPVGFTPYKLKKGEEYMNPDQIEHFRKILLLWKQQLLLESDETVHHMQDDAANPPDPLDRATLEADFNLTLRTRDRERKLVKKIDEAIERIDNQEYGYCTDCGAEIGIGRLEARPTATQCIDCKTFEEIREKQIGG